MAPARAGDTVVPCTSPTTTVGVLPAIWAPSPGPQVLLGPPEAATGASRYIHALGTGDGAAAPADPPGRAPAGTVPEPGATTCAHSALSWAVRPSSGVPVVGNG